MNSPSANFISPVRKGVYQSTQKFFNVKFFNTTTFTHSNNMRMNTSQMLITIKRGRTLHTKQVWKAIGRNL